jgi:predicted ABC-type ATPase
MNRSTLKIAALITELLAPTNSPALVVLTGSNGAGKSTFYQLILKGTGLPFVNADEIAKTLPLQIGQSAEARAYLAATMADQLRRELASQKLPFIFETVFRDERGDKLKFLADCEAAGYSVLVIFVGITGFTLSQARVIARVSLGGHDVPDNKLRERFPRTLANLTLAITNGLSVLLIDNTSASNPYRLVAYFQKNQLAWVGEGNIPVWAKNVHPSLSKKS